ncbi:hypothetical protein Z043_113290 [Scleropages formosus]|uniref:Uncharacterized protein n=1 Tax=Scleropages formosus TaxID=113540 RepID=A0A0P7UIG9_SCLFO|nr:hypothetical protein Z043_113290 [Scleropages formosus]
MAHFSDKDKNKGKDYCIFFNSQWARLPQDLNKAVSPSRRRHRRFLPFPSRLSRSCGRASIDPPRCRKGNRFLL